MVLPNPEASNRPEQITELVEALEHVQTKAAFIALVKGALETARVSPEVATATMEKINDVFDDPRRIDELFPKENSQPYFRKALKRLSSISLN